MKRAKLTPMTTADFRDHIKALCLGPNWIRPANPLLTRPSTRINRKPTDANYVAAESEAK